MPNEAPALLGNDLFGEPVRRAPQAPLAERFLFPPFSVLNAREGGWQERKEAWLALGIKSEEGRKANEMGYGIQAANIDFYAKKRALEAELGRTLTTPEANAALLERGDIAPAEEGGTGGGTSVFDPVLTEAVYRWFAPPGGLVLDPFAGGSVRGVVAGFLGLRYYGIDLRAEQVAANLAQRDALVPGAPVEWIVGDSRVSAAGAPDADLVFTCPPYGDLEQYSEDPRDLSNMDYPVFLAALRDVVAGAVGRLRPNRFAAIVVGEFRDEKGLYRNFVGHTVDAFRRAGAGYYNEAVLLTAIGSTSMRTGRQFEIGRKFGKVHQNLLVFLKGDPKIATAALRAAPPTGVTT